MKPKAKRKDSDQIKSMARNAQILSLRHKIDKLDEQIAKLIEKRLLLTDKAIDLKIKMKAPFQDKIREKKILKNYLHRLKLQSSGPRVQRFVVALLGLYPKL